jgi:3-dehydroquinate synthetase
MKRHVAALNLGHTVGHALETVSNYQISHGEAVSVGMYLEACLSEALGIAEKGLAESISTVLRRLDLPVSLPDGLSADSVLEAMRVDKKKADGDLRFALPVKIGEVQVGVRVVGKDLNILKKILEDKR